MANQQDPGTLDTMVNEVERRVDHLADAAKMVGKSAEASVTDITSAVDSVVSGGTHLAGATYEDAVDFAHARIKEGLDLLRKLKDVVTG